MRLSHAARASASAADHFAADDAPAARSPRRVRRWRAAVPWALLGLVLIGQYALFRAYVAREIAWGYPRLWDQAVYLAHTYEIYDVWRHDGPWSALESAWRSRLPQGLLLPFEAVPLLRLLGPSRLSALTLAFLHFAALQVVLVVTLRRLAPGWCAPALGLGLLWCTHSQLSWGGLTDFRLDFMAMCLYGIWLCIVLRSDTLGRRRGAVVAAAAAVLAGLFRHVVFAYVVATLLAFWVLDVLVTRRYSLPPVRSRGAARALALVTVVLVPWAFAEREALHAYYWVGHVHLGPVMASGMGLSTLADRLLYYPRSLVDTHTGVAYGALAALILALAVAVRFVDRRRASARCDAPAPALGAAVRLLACATLAPLALLTFDTAKSPIVANVLLPGLTLLIVLPAVASLRAGVRAVVPLRVLAAGALVAGAAQQAELLCAPGPLNGARADAVAITALHEAIARVSLEQGWRQPRVFADSSQEHTLPWNAEVMAYERYGTRVQPRLTLPVSHWADAEPGPVAAALERAQLAVVTRTRRRALPDWARFDRAMTPLRGAIMAACRRDFVRAGRFRIHGWNVELWFRAEAQIVTPRPSVDGSRGVTPASGLTVEAAAATLRERPRLRLDGRGAVTWRGGRRPVVHAALCVVGRRARVLPVEAAWAGSRYALRADVDPSWLPREGRVRVRFDFEPDASRSASDSAHVAALPEQVRLLRATARARPLAEDFANDADASARP